MGNICNNVQEESGSSLQVALNLSKKQDYEAVELSQYPYLENRIEWIVKNNQQFHNFNVGKQLRKLKDKNLFYYGQWDPNGFPKGKGIQHVENQYLYYGQFDSLPSGKGVYQSFTNKFIYEGQLRFGSFQGQGKLTKPENMFTFQGIFNNNSQPVTGVASIHNPQDQSKSYTVTLDNYPVNKAKIVYNDNREYEGQINFTNFAPHGLGRAIFANKSIYEGSWENGQFHGHGKFVWTDGSSYEGNYAHGKKKGFGVFTYTSKKSYKGNWEEGLQNGEGCLYDQEGNPLKNGLWVNGKFDKKIQQ